MGYPYRGSDLSYRAQMRGWKFDYLPDVVVPAELPPQVEAYKKQQFRWAKGSFQVVRKILPSVLQAKLPLKVRFMALLHLTGYFVHPLMLSVLLLTLPVGLLIPGAFRVFPISVVAGLGPPLLLLNRNSDPTSFDLETTAIVSCTCHCWVRSCPSAQRLLCWKDYLAKAEPLSARRN